MPDEQGFPTNVRTHFKFYKAVPPVDEDGAEVQFEIAKIVKMPELRMTRDEIVALGPDDADYWDMFALCYN